VLCIHCSRDLDADSAFCRFCGAAAREPSANPRRLTRRPDEGRIAGVCAGIAAYLRADVTFVRLAWVILSVWPGALVFGAIAYVVAWIIVPAASGTESRAATSSPARLFRSQTDRKLGGVCGGLAAYLGADATLVRLAAAIVGIVPGAIVMGVVAYGVAWFIIPASPSPTLHTSLSTQ
jgi:phage shock protein PspC (stress-responsive transcriptional regulator)